MVPPKRRARCFRVLTPESASPEQLRGETDYDATDIYALGMLLYRLITGSSPYRVSTTSETELVRAICEEPPEPPSASPRSDSGIVGKQAIDRDLDRIVLMALRKEPERRYGTPSSSPKMSAATLRAVRSSRRPTTRCTARESSSPETAWRWQPAAGF